jgi:hypothetical protein
VLGIYTYIYIYIYMLKATCGLLTTARLHAKSIALRFCAVESNSTIQNPLSVPACYSANQEISCCYATQRFIASSKVGHWTLSRPNKFTYLQLTHPASYPMGTRGSFPGGKAAGA